MPCLLIHHLLSVIFELIKGEMAYVRDLENIETVCDHSSLFDSYSKPDFVDVCSTATERRATNNSS